MNKLKWTKKEDKWFAEREDGLKYKVRKIGNLKGAVSLSVKSRQCSVWKFYGNMFSLKDAKNHAELDNKIFLQMKKLSLNI